MTIERDDPAGPEASGESKVADHVCRRVAGVLGPILIARHQLPPAAVEVLMEDAFASFRGFHRSLKEPELWLVQRIVAKAREYAELRALEPQRTQQPPGLVDLVRTRSAVDALPPNARAALRMLCTEGKSWEAIAEELDVTVVYAHRLVTKALRMLRKWAPPAE